MVANISSRFARCHQFSWKRNEILKIWIVAMRIIYINFTKFCRKITIMKYLKSWLKTHEDQARDHQR